MKYRTLGKTGLLVSEISLGCEHLQGKSFDTIKKVIDCALDSGINYMDVFMSEPNVRTNIGLALKGRRENVIIQGHIGSCWVNGQYKVSRDINECIEGFDDLLTRLGTDYIDIGFIHFVDKETDWDNLPGSDMMKYVMNLKDRGIIRAIGLSSHNPVTAKKAIETGLVDVLMFSLNPAYDLVPKERDMVDVFNEVLEGRSQDFTDLVLEPAREELYRACENKGVAITVMKTLAMGTLLDEKRSPLGVALTEPQCINYALTRPAVATVVVGMQNIDDIKNAMSYYAVSDEERDHSKILASLNMFNSSGRCMYCNHCLPCPVKIDIASINKYLDLVVLDGRPVDSVRQHYYALGNTAEMCVSCGQCEKRCPFEVSVISRMKKAADVFKT